jgi:hypothetical protein
LPNFSKKEKKDKHKKKQKHYSGIYNDVEYFSCLELAVILYCEAMNFSIKNCSVGPIEYFDSKKNKIRKYHPDFIINDFLIVEVKWLGFIYEKKKDEILAKKESLEKFCEKFNYGCLFVTNNLVKRKFIDRAKRIHNDRDRKKIFSSKRKNRKSRRDK